MSNSKKQYISYNGINFSGISNNRSTKWIDLYSEDIKKLKEEVETLRRIIDSIQITPTTLEFSKLQQRIEKLELELSSRPQPVEIEKITEVVEVRRPLRKYLDNIFIRLASLETYTQQFNKGKKKQTNNINKLSRQLKDLTQKVASLQADRDDKRSNKKPDQTAARKDNDSIKRDRRNS